MIKKYSIPWLRKYFVVIMLTLLVTSLSIEYLLSATVRLIAVILHPYYE